MAPDEHALECMHVKTQTHTHTHTHTYTQSERETQRHRDREKQGHMKQTNKKHSDTKISDIRSAWSLVYRMSSRTARSTNERKFFRAHNRGSRAG